MRPGTRQRALAHAPGLAVVEAPRLDERTTMRLGGHALAEVRLTEERALDALPGLLDRLGGRPVALGRGSNVLAADGALPLVLISLHGRRETWIAGETKDTVFLGADAGLPLSALLARTAALGLSGFENLCGIPGSVGGAVAMNAGSYGSDISDIVREVVAFLPGSGLTLLPRERLEMGYRSFAVKGHSGWGLVTKAVFALKRTDRERVREYMVRTYRQKKATQPITAWSAGCVFKNPHADYPAGKLLQDTGLRGYRLGGMAFSPVHANFMVNEGRGTFAQAMELISMARDKVMAFTGFSLELEIRLWP